MSTNIVQEPKLYNHPPPPYTVDPTGSNFMATTSATRMAYRENSPHVNRCKEDGNLLTLMQIGSIIVLVLCSLSCIIALHRNTKIMEQNLELLERQLSTLEQNKNAASTLSRGRIKRMISPMDSCPPCPTEAPPNPIEPHKNPVSVLNEEVGKRANYEVVWGCEDPPIHHATLKIINDPAFEGKSWSGKGRNMQAAKQAAAWEAIQNDLPHLIEFVADEYKPPLYNPVCKRPHYIL